MLINIVFVTNMKSKLTSSGLRHHKLWRWMQQGPPKCSYPTTTLHGVNTVDLDLNLHHCGNLSFSTLWKVNWQC